MSQRASELLYGLPIAILILTLSFSSFTGHFMTHINNHLRGDVYANSNHTDLYLESLPEYELSDFLLDTETVGDDDDTGRSQLLNLVDGVMGIGTLVFALLASGADTLSASTFIGTLLLANHYVLHKTTYRNRVVTTTRLFMNLGVVLIAVMICSAPTMVGNHATSKRALYSLVTALFFSGWQYSSLLTFTRAADESSSGEALVSFKRLLTSCWVVGLIAISACVVVIVWADVQIESDRIRPVFLNSAALGAGFVVSTYTLAAMSPFASARMLVAPLAFCVLIARAHGESDAGKITGSVFVVLAGLLFWCIIQSFGLQSRLSLLYLCVSESTAGHLTPLQHASWCCKQLFAGITHVGAQRSRPMAGMISHRHKEGASYRLPMRKTRYNVCNRGSQLALDDPAPDEYTPGREERVITVSDIITESSHLLIR